MIVLFIGTQFSNLVSVRYVSVFRWSCRNTRNKLTVQTGGSGHYDWEKRNFLIVNVLLTIVIEFAHHNKT